MPPFSFGLRSFVAGCLTSVVTLSAFAATPARDPAKLATELCAGCHGPNLVGGTAPNLVDGAWQHGGDDESVLRSIRVGFPEKGMAGFGAAMTEEEMRAMLAYMRRLGRQFALGLIPALLPAPPSVEIKSAKHTFRLETVAEPLDTPWGIAFLPDGMMIVSDRVGKLRLIAKDGKLQSEPVRGSPQPFARQDGGYLDLIAHPDYARNGWLYLAYTELAVSGPGSMTRIVRGKIRDGAWVEQQDVYRAPQALYFNDTSHYGCRFLFDRDGSLFFTLGDRGNAAAAQDLSSPMGKIHRVRDDGQPAPGNPFLNTANALPTVWSYGHRHVQGLQYHPATGKLWATEHGPRGGDELNRVDAGKNYGWPTISDGLAQGREKIEGKEREGMQRPVVSWTPSVAPAAIEFYAGDRFPRWKNSLFVACLIGRQLKRIETDGDKVTHEEILFTEMGRVRDVITGPDGLIYLAMNTPGRIARLVPVD